mmetsp:Transcript_9965/g.11201  ORF Transcript_9965/g.11201 Transcript_9965/m.11201 type:complete len:85 (-) Transcript_9965:201-455(-)
MSIDAKNMQKLYKVKGLREFLKHGSQQEASIPAYLANQQLPKRKLLSCSFEVAETSCRPSTSRILKRTMKNEIDSKRSNKTNDF